MKKLIFLIGIFLITMFLPSTVSAQDVPYTEGTVWNITFVRTKPGMDRDYLRNLAVNWRKQNEEFKKQGLIVSYKILSGTAANKEDWDLMLMIEYKNMAAFDGLTDKMNKVMLSMTTEDKEREGYVKRMDMREILGTKLVQEIMLK